MTYVSDPPPGTLIKHHLLQGLVCVEVQSRAGVHVSAKSSAEPECVGGVALQKQRFIEVK